MVINSFSFFLSGKLGVCPSIPIDSIAGWSDLAYGALLFTALTVSCQSILASMVSVEKLSDILMGAPL